MTEQTRLSPPWAAWAAECEALFEGDDEVTVVYDGGGDAPKVTLLVDNPAKADALAKVVAPEVAFGGVTMAVEVVPANDGLTPEQAMLVAFAGNPAFAGTASEERMGATFSFALFEPVVAQFECDDASSPYGVRTMALEAVARDVLRPDLPIGVCSDLVDGYLVGEADE